MATNVYEGLFILDSNRFAKDPDSIPGQIQQIIEKHGGEILVHRLWDERRLAYPIKGHRKGTYWLSYFRVDSSKVKEIHWQCQLNENILRLLFLKIDPRIVDAVVSHARSAAVAPPAAAAEEHPATEIPVVVDAIDDEVVEETEEDSEEIG